MKKPIIFSISLLWLILLFLQQGCKTSKDDILVPPSDEWTTEDEQTFEAQLDLQEQGFGQFETFLQTLDTAAAIESLAQWFKSQPTVEWCQSGSQGVSVKYKSGLYGLVMVDGKDGGDSEFENKVSNYVESSLTNLKSTPNKKRVVLFNPSYNERRQQFDLLQLTYDLFYTKVFDEEYNVTYKKDTECTLGWLNGNLKNYGYIHLYSHGWAWPNEKAISEVYLMLAESPYALGNEMFKEDIRKASVIAGYSSSLRRNVYWISPQFIADHNYFQNDTAIIYGGFCYSYLGNWPNLVNSFAAGGYYGFNWSVKTNKNTLLASKLFEYLSDTSLVIPWATQTWMTGTPNILKEYYDAEDKITVKLQYNGDNDITLWEPKYKFSIIATAPEGDPIEHPGKTGIEYEFKCLDRNKEIGEGLRFQWIFADGTPAEEIEGINIVKHTWNTEGTFKITVNVFDIQSGKLLGIAEANATVEKYYDYLPLLQTMKSIQAVIYGNGHHYYDDGSQCPDLIAFNYYITDGGELAWDGQNFSAGGSFNGNWEHVSLSGYVSQDADSLLYLRAIYTFTGGLDETLDSLSFELRNIPLFNIYEGQPPHAEYQVTGAQSQSHLFNLYYKKMTTWQNYLYYHHSDWNYVTVSVSFALNM